MEGRGGGERETRETSVVRRLVASRVKEDARARVPFFHWNVSRFMIYRRRNIGHRKRFNGSRNKRERESNAATFRMKRREERKEKKRGRGRGEIKEGVVSSWKFRCEELRGKVYRRVEACGNDETAKDEGRER